MFSELPDFYGVQPQNIVHIGDSPADVLGAKRCGIKACWINRDGAAWEHKVRPDMTVSRLDEIRFDLL